MNIDMIFKLTKWCAAFCVAESLVAAVTNFHSGNMSAGMGYVTATMYAICWRIALGTRRPEDGDCDEN